VVIVDQQTHPRFAIGESSTPAADYLLHHLATIYNLPELESLTRFGAWRKSHPDIRCGCKRGFSYVWHGTGSDYRADDEHSCELMVTANASEDLADTQWYRPHVDQFFFRLAQMYGAQTLESTNVEGLEQQEEGWTISLNRSSQKFVIQASFLIDGSGPQSKLMQQENVLDCTSQLKTRTNAVFSHFCGGQRTEQWLRDRQARSSDFPYPFDHAAVHHLFHDGWLWQIGFVDNLTSLGFVSTKPIADWSAVLRTHPVLETVLSDAILADFPGRFHSIERIQRLRSRAAGHRWIALPFTVGFVDPLHSTGIAHSLSGVERICEIALSNDDSMAQCLMNRYEVELVSEMLHIDRLIATCYLALNDFRLFTATTMLYFAAATSYERLHRKGENPRFLLADNDLFSSVVEWAFDQMTKLQNEASSQSEIDSFISQLKMRLTPFNHVGLFEPRIPNMYRQTAAEK
jgi:FADH2 O2-dependent halogenase